MQFKLKSKFRPTGDQPQAIEALVSSVTNHTPHQTLLGVTGSGKTFTLANVIERTQKPTLVISHNKTLAAQLYQEFRDFFPDNAVSYFVSYYDYYQPEAYIPSTDTYIEKETDINDEIDKLRLSATANLLSRPDVIVIASVSCIYNLGSPVEYGKNFLRLIPGLVLSPQSLMTRLVDMQYLRSEYDLKRGSFRLRGDTLQIWPADLDHALTLSLLENTIESITPINPISGEQIKNPDHTPGVKSEGYVIYPAKHYQTAGGDQAEAFQQIKTDLAYRLQELKQNGKIVEAYRLGQKVQHDLETMQEFGYVNGIENYSRYFDGRKEGDPPYSLLDYFRHNAEEFNTDGFLTIVDESHITIPQIRGMYAGDRSRKQTLIDYGFRLPSALDNRPLKFTEFLARVPQVIYSSATPEAWELEQSGGQIAEQLIRPTGLIDPEIEVRPSKNQIEDLVQEIGQRVSHNQRVLVTTLTKRTAEALTEYLNADHPGGVKPKVAYLHSDITTLDRSDILDSLRQGEFDVVVGINLLREGLDLPEVSLVAILEADKEGFLRSRTSLIQTMGRAARHEEGRVIMYADRVTPSMQAAIEEVNRRREIQIAYNRQHGITPISIAKPIRDKLLNRIKEDETEKKTPKEMKKYGWETMADINPETLTPKDKKALVKLLKKLMNQAAKDWDFEKAAQYRDTIAKLQ